MRQILDNTNKIVKVWWVADFIKEGLNISFILAITRILVSSIFKNKVYQE